MKNVTRILVRFALNLYILFGRIVTSIMYILLIQEHERPSCSLPSSSISLQRVPSLPYLGPCLDIFEAITNRLFFPDFPLSKFVIGEYRS